MRPSSERCLGCGTTAYIMYGVTWVCICGHENPRAIQPADGYRKLVVPPPGPNVRYEDCFPESCCEGAPAPLPAKESP